MKKFRIPASLVIFLKGMAMGTADIIPGVSGGTIALITGIYHRFIDAIAYFSPVIIIQMMNPAAVWNVEQRFRTTQAWQKADWKLLLPLISGILAALFLMSGILPRLLTDYPLQMYSLFTGLILFSAQAPWKSVGRNKKRRVVVLLLSVALTVTLVLSSSAGSGSHTAGKLFLSAMLAITAMVLPGISGSYILVILGEYAYVLQAVHDRNLLILGIFTSGVLAGLLVFVRFLKYLLSRYYDLTMSVLTGMMLGSLVKIWPLHYGSGFADILIFLLCSAAGILLVVLLSRLAATRD